MEAVFERIDVKHEIFKKIDPLLGEKTLVASNTSAIPITEIAAAVSRPERFVGLHFFNPVPMMQAVEVIRGISTSDEAFQAGAAFVKLIGKEPILVNRDIGGFILNRINMLSNMEAYRLVEQGVATPEDIDKGHEAGLRAAHGALRDFGPGRARGPVRRVHEHVQRGKGPAFLPAGDSEAQGHRRPVGPQDGQGLVRIQPGRNEKGQEVMELKDAKALVTGGASGLGEATVRAVVAAGGRAGVVDMDRERAEKLVDELGSAVVFAPADVTSESDIDRAVADLKAALGGLNVAVNCAGMGGVGQDSGQGRPDERRAVQPLASAQRGRDLQRHPGHAGDPLPRTTPTRRASGGVYVNTASIAAFDGQVGQAGYSASKGGVVSLGLTLAREFALNGIRVMTILPGIMNTPHAGPAARTPPPAAGRAGPVSPEAGQAVRVRQPGLPHH